MENAVEYFMCRNRIAGDIRAGLVNPTPEAIFEAFKDRAGLDAFEAASAAQRFFSDLQRGLDRK